MKLLFKPVGTHLFLKRLSYLHGLISDKKSQEIPKDGGTLRECFASLCRERKFREAMSLMGSLARHGVRADPFSYSMLIGFCIDKQAVGDGKIIHHHICMGSNERPPLFLVNQLINMYVNFGLMEEARDLLHEMPERDVISWTTVIAAYSKIGFHREALELLVLMLRDNVPPNHYTFSSVLKACSSLTMLELLHCPLIKTGLVTNAFVRCSLIDAYAKWGNIQCGFRVFKEAAVWDTNVWNAIIGGFALDGDSYMAIDLYLQMRRMGFMVNQGTLTCILRACTGLALLDVGQQIHTLAMKATTDLILNNSLLDLYSKCGSVDDAVRLFERMSKRDVISWSTIISGLAQNGKSVKALQFFDSMIASRITPNSITLVGVLFACSHAGLLEKGWCHYRSMESLYGIRPGKEHYGCMVDLLGRSGRLEEAWKFIKENNIEDDAVILEALLSACRVHKDADLATEVANRILELQPFEKGTFVLLSNIFAEANRWGNVEDIRKTMRKKRIMKEPGCSWIELEGHIHTFIVGDKSHPEMDAIEKKVDKLVAKVKELGYVPDISFTLHDIEIEQKKELLKYHSEKLAIAYGLMRFQLDKPIRIMKNLRICGDCHNFAKLVSQIEHRYIVIRDPIRFHHFAHGHCTCGDYW